MAAPRARSPLRGRIFCVEAIIPSGIIPSGEPHLGGSAPSVVAGTAGTSSGSSTVYINESQEKQAGSAGCDVEPLDEDQARRVGELVGKAARTDVVDGAVVEGALRRQSTRGMDPDISPCWERNLDPQQRNAISGPLVCSLLVDCPGKRYRGGQALVSVARGCPIELHGYDVGG